MIEKSQSTGRPINPSVKALQMEIAPLLMLMKTMMQPNRKTALKRWLLTNTQLSSSSLCKVYSSPHVELVPIFCHRKRLQAKFEQWDCLQWTETKRVYARIKKECSDQFEYFRKIPWCIRPIFPHQANSSIFMIQMEAENYGVLLANQVSRARYILHLNTKSGKTNKIKSDRILLAGTRYYCHSA